MEGRLRKLEDVLTDGSGLLPHTERWRAYWITQMEKFLNGDKDALRRCTVEAFRICLEARQAGHIRPPMKVAREGQREQSPNLQTA